MDASRDGSAIVVESDSDVVPPIYHLLNTSTRSLLTLVVASKALAHAQLAPTQSASALVRSHVLHELWSSRTTNNSLEDPAMRVALYSKLEAFLAATLGSS